MNEMLPSGFHWNQADEASAAIYKEVLVAILAFNKDREPALVGTGFPIATFNDGLLCLTAAHNFGHLEKIQNPRNRSHQSAVDIFKPNTKAVSLDRRLVRALMLSPECPEPYVIAWAGWNEQTDVAVFAIAPQKTGASCKGRLRLDLDGSIPEIGETVATLGFDMSIKSSLVEGNGKETLTAGFRPILRVGSVLDYHKDGHLMCRGPLIETSIPIESGFSGGPAFVIRKDQPVRPFGVISSDSDVKGESKVDVRVSGRSLIAVAPADVDNRGGDSISTKLDLGYSYILQNDEFKKAE